MADNDSFAVPSGHVEALFEPSSSNSTPLGHNTNFMQSTSKGRGDQTKKLPHAIDSPRPGVKQPFKSGARFPAKSIPWIPGINKVISEKGNGEKGLQADLMVESFPPLKEVVNVSSVVVPEVVLEVASVEKVSPQELEPSSSNPPALPVRSFLSALKGGVQEIKGSVKPTTVSTSDCILNEDDCAQPIVFDGVSRLRFSRESKKTFTEPTKFSLVGKFTSGRPSIHAIRKAFNGMNLKGGYHLSLIDNSHLLIQCDLKEDFVYIWLRRVWYVLRFPMYVSRWTTKFSKDFESPIVPVWISLPYLPVHCFNPLALTSIGNYVGTPLKVDINTKRKTNMGLARICVAIDISKPRKNEVLIEFGDPSDVEDVDDDSFWQKLIYENIPLYCDHCRGFDHVRESCYGLLSNKGKEKEAEMHLEDREFRDVTPTNKPKSLKSIIVAPNGGRRDKESATNNAQGRKQPGVVIREYRPVVTRVSESSEVGRVRGPLEGEMLECIEELSDEGKQQRKSLRASSVPGSPTSASLSRDGGQNDRHLQPISQSSELGGSPDQELLPGVQGRHEGLGDNHLNPGSTGEQQLNVVSPVIMLSDDDATPHLDVA